MITSNDVDILRAQISNLLNSKSPNPLEAYDRAGDDVIVLANYIKVADKETDKMARAQDARNHLRQSISINNRDLEKIPTIDGSPNLTGANTCTLKLIKYVKYFTQNLSATPLIKYKTFVVKHLRHMITFVKKKRKKDSLYL